MSSVMRRAVVWTLVLLLATATDGAARGGRGGGGGRGGFGGGGFSRGGGGFSRHGVASGGSLREQSARRPPEDWQGGHEERQERRQERQEHREERREDWHDETGDYYGDYDDGYYPYDAVGGEVLATPPWWTLDCAAPIDLNGTTYYECESAWYVRVYHEGEVAYARVDPPPGH